MDLEHFLVISLDGSVVKASDCFLVNSRVLNDEEEEALDGSDEDRAELARGLGYSLTDLALGWTNPAT